MTGAEILNSLGTRLGTKIQERIEFRGETTFLIDRADLREVATFCKEEVFDYLLDISSVDNFGTEPRFEVVYELYSMTLAIHLRLKLRVSEEDPTVDTVSDIWPTANWHEREIWDMMGLRFNNHPDLRRILMWEGYPYFPLRKEFPLEGLPSDMPDVAFTSAAPMEGGPFVTSQAPPPRKTASPAPAVRSANNAGKGRARWLADAFESPASPAFAGCVTARAGDGVPLSRTTLTTGGVDNRLAVIRTRRQSLPRCQDFVD